MSIIALIVLLLFASQHSYVDIKRHDIKVLVKGAIKEEKTLLLKNGTKLSDLLHYIEIIDGADKNFFYQEIYLKNNDVVLVPLMEKESLISINAAAAAELTKLKGVGPVLAQRIVDYRLENGLFQKLEDIKRVKGIKEKTFEKIKADICL